MKKFLFACFAMLTCSGFGQIILSSHALILKKPSEKQQSIIAVDSRTQQVFAFVSDKENLIGFKYNSALFYKDSIATARPEKGLAMAGYSFSDDGNAEIYWAADDLKKIMGVTYNFDSKTTTEKIYELPFTDETISNSFSENNTFYVLSVNGKANVLKIYLFSNGQMNVKELDFSTYAFSDDSGKDIPFDVLLEKSPLELIDTKAVNILASGVQKNKLYVGDNKITITVNDDPAVTRLLEISLTDFKISEKTFQQPKLDKPGRSNAYFHQNTLYQLALNKKEMALSATNLNDPEAFKTYRITETDSITFKNSPLYSQTGNQRATSLKNTKKFLRRLEDAQIGLTVYKTPNDLLLTVGGIHEVATTGDVLLGITVGVGMVLGGTGGSIDGLLGDHSTQAVFFESLFDEKFNHKNLEQQRLATDYIAQFLEEHDDIALQNITPCKDFFIMGYYDPKAKQYVLRKFSDDKSLE